MWGLLMEANSSPEKVAKAVTCAMLYGIIKIKSNWVANASWVCSHPKGSTIFGGILCSNEYFHGCKCAEYSTDIMGSSTGVGVQGECG